MKANESKFIHVTFSTWRETRAPMPISNVRLLQKDVKYIGLQLDKRHTCRKHICPKGEQLGMTPTKIYYLFLTVIKTLHKQQNCRKQYWNQSGPMEYKSAVRLPLET
jgi:hypothetical protein